MNNFKLSPLLNVSDEFRKEFDKWLTDTFNLTKTVTKEPTQKKSKIYRKQRK